MPKPTKSKPEVAQQDNATASTAAPAEQNGLAGANHPAVENGTSPATTAAPEPTTEDVAADLAAAEEGEGAQEKPVAVMKPAATLDLAMFTEEQRQMLRDALSVTSAAATDKKRKNPTVELRTIDGRNIVEFSSAYKKKIYDEEQQKEVVRTHITVRFEGDTFVKWEDAPSANKLLYREFNGAPRIVAEVVGTVETPYTKDLGFEVFSKEQKQNVPVVVNYVRRILTLRLPDKREISMDATFVN